MRTGFLGRFAAPAALILSGCVQHPANEGTAVTLSIVSTNDVHGELQADRNRGGLVTISGYVNALRSAHGDQNVLLVDAGDMWLPPTASTGCRH